MSIGKIMIDKLVAFRDRIYSLTVRRNASDKERSLYIKLDVLFDCYYVKDGKECLLSVIEEAEKDETISSYMREDNDFSEISKEMIKKLKEDVFPSGNEDDRNMYKALSIYELFTEPLFDEMLTESISEYIASK